MAAQWLVWCALGVLASGPAHGENLLQAYDEARVQDQTFAAAQATYRAAVEALPQGRAGLLPTIGLSASAQRNNLDTQYVPGLPKGMPLVTGTQAFGSHGYALTLDQPLFNVAKYARYQASKYAVAQAQTTLAIAEQELMVRVAAAYFAVLQAQDDVAFAKAQMKALAGERAQAERRFRVGTATIVDTREAEARYDAVAAQELAAEDALQVKRYALETIIGHAPSTLAPLGAGLPLGLPRPNRMAAWVSAARTQNLTLQTRELQSRIAAEDVARAKGGNDPTLDLVASDGYTYAGATPFGVGEKLRAQAIGVELNLPIFEGGLVSSRIRQAQATQDAAQDQVRQAAREVALETRQAFLGVTDGAAQVRAARLAVLSAKSSLDATALGLKVGVRTNVDLLNAQQAYFDARRNLSEARYAYILSELKLRLAVGTLKEADLVRVNGWLAPTAPGRGPAP